MSEAGKLILETKRPVLRRQVPPALDAPWGLYCDPENTRYIPDAPRSREEAKEELEWHMNGHPRFPELGLWATIHKEMGKFIGRCGLLPWTIDERQEVEVAYTISRDYWGQGLATEAAQAILDYGFERLNLIRLISIIDPENMASQKVAQKIGMKFEKEAQDELGTFWIFSINK